MDDGWTYDEEEDPDSIAEDGPMCTRWIGRSCALSIRRRVSTDVDAAGHWLDEGRK